MTDPYSSSEALRQYWSTHEQSENELAMLGFEPAARPKFTCPVINSETLTTANLDQYTDIFVRITRWLDYAENTLARIKSILASRKTELDQLEVFLRKSLVGQKNPATEKAYSLEDKKTFIESQPRYIELLREIKILEEQKIQMESHVSGRARDYALVSRQIELRKLDISGEKIGNNIPNRGPGMNYR